jgi:hypothetical protein
MLKLVVYIPETYLELVKNAMFAHGAGQHACYDQVAWQTLGIGQFRALHESEPFVGDIGQVQITAEYRLEMICQDHLLTAVIDAIKAVHPYETPAIDILRLEHYPAEL